MSILMIAMPFPNLQLTSSSHYLILCIKLVLYLIFPKMFVPSPDQLQDLILDECEVYNILSSLDPSKAMGIDSKKYLKYCACSLCSPITALFNKCLSSSLFLASGKCNLSPILKSGDSSNDSNYRPSLPCVPYLKSYL